MDLNTLKIVQHNVLAWTFNRRNELFNIYRTLDPDIILINAHGRKNEERIKLFNYNVYQRNSLNENNAGVAIAIRINLKHQIIDDLEDDFLALKVTTTQGPLIIATGYLPPRNPTLPHNNFLRLFRNQFPVLLAGDLNARHHILDHGNDNAIGELIYQYMRGGNATHVGPFFKTYVTPRASGTPDIVLVNNKFNYNIQISPGPLTTSDHLPLVIRMSTSPLQVPVPPRLNFHNANWENFATQLSSFTIPNLDRQPRQKIDEQLDRWFTAVQAAMDNNIPVTTFRTLPHIKLTKEVHLIQQAYKNIMAKANNTGWTEQLRNTMKVLQNNMASIMKEQGEKYWEKLLQNTEKTYRQPQIFWKEIRKLMGMDSNSTPYILDPQGNKLTSDEDIANEFRRHLKNTFQITEEDNNNFCQRTQQEVNEYLRNTDQHKPFETIDLSRLNVDNRLTKPITRNELIGKINSFKNRKAPGQSGINKVILQRLPLNMLDALKDILNAALSAGYFPQFFKHALIKMLLKQGKQSIHSVNYRPISLLESTGKAFEKILNDKLKNFLHTNNLNNHYQHSYKKNRGTISALAITYEKIASTQQEHHQCNVIGRDVSKAFDKVWHEGLKFKICRLQMPRTMTSILCNFLDNRTATVQTNNHKSAPFELKAGVPQGSVLAPTLFNLFTGDVGELVHSNYTAYADDITQIIHYHGPSKEMLKRKTQRAIEELNSFERKWKIKTNNTKFQMVHISKYNPLPITVDNQNIRYTRSAKILGLTLKGTGITAHIKDQRNKAYTTLKKLRRFKKLNPKLKLHLFKALILPIIDYPTIPMNTLKPSNWKKQQAVQNKALRWINGDVPPYETTIKELHTKYNLEPLNIRNYRLAYGMWEKIRTEFPMETEEFENSNYNRTHAWWPLSYMKADATEPRPIYGNIGDINVEGNGQRRNDNDEEDGEG